jgi:hypothetical protein
METAKPEREAWETPTETRITRPVKRSPTYFAAGAGTLIATLWLLGAVKAGYFIVDRHAMVPNSSELETVTVFPAEDRHFITIDGWRVAYVDEGSGPPTLGTDAAVSAMSLLWRLPAAILFQRMPQFLRDSASRPAP